MTREFRITGHKPFGAFKDAEGERIQNPKWSERSKNPLPFKVTLGPRPPRIAKIPDTPPHLTLTSDSGSSLGNIFDGIRCGDGGPSGSKGKEPEVKYVDKEYEGPNLGPTKHIGIILLRPPTFSTLSAASSVPSETTPVRYEKAAMPTDAATLGKIKCNAQLSAFPYDREPDSLPDGWAPSSDLSDKIAAAANIVQADNVQNPYGTIVDAQSGLVASVLVNAKQNEVVISFGGTSSGPEVRAGEPLKRGLANLWPMSKQWVTNVSAGFGNEEASYRQARELVGKAVELAGENVTVRTAGHSKGGGEAMYAALAQTPPLNADVFSPSHLSSGLISRLPKANVDTASKGVRAYSVSKDLVPKIRSVLPWGAAGVGRDHFFPADPTKGHGMSPYNVHVWFTEHLDSYIEKALREKSPEGSSQGLGTSAYQTASEGGSNTSEKAGD
ncbi:hypothetical protein HLB44_34805 [Aquincola sp. S2]|uniref:Fungal lipase-like domain-containing protein n=1 Tax=Pseudaquabacterium terrae TaxID=2732868 RepID=A0ABX2ETT7_9BURK|nr:hypothetical protein [Aquabacterium terrae]NRF72167.1 hypothetical protein [Aquabacterium terrae]